MKHLRLFDKATDFETSKETLEFPWLCFVEETSKSVCMSTYKPNTSVWYKIEDNILYIRGTEQEGYSERVLYTDATLAKNGWYNAPNKAEITKSVIEEVISPTSCVRFFDGMSGMATIENIENLKTDNATSMFTMFQGCSVLVSIGDISNWNVSNVTDMTGMFNTDYALTSIGDLSNWNVGMVTNMRQMFNKCYALTSIGDLNNWNVGNVTNMMWMFSECNSLTSVGDISNWNVSKVTSMRAMFNDCHALISVGDLSKWDVGNVTDMRSMFNADGPNPLILTSIGDISGWNVANVTDMSYMFRGCTSLDELNLSSWNTSKVTTMYEAFSNFNAWNKYTDFSIPKINVPPIPKNCNVDHAFSFDYSLTTIESSGKISKSLNFQWSPLTHDSAMVLINALDSENTGTLTLSTATKETLSEEEIAIATDKGWTIASA